jgi:hypothetical protein
MKEKAESRIAVTQSTRKRLGVAAAREDSSINEMIEKLLDKYEGKSKSAKTLKSELEKQSPNRHSQLRAIKFATSAQSQELFPKISEIFQAIAVLLDTCWGRKLPGDIAEALAMLHALCNLDSNEHNLMELVLHYMGNTLEVDNKLSQDEE